MSPFANTGILICCLDGAHGFVFGIALIHVRAGAPVNRERLNAAVLGDSRDADAVLVVRVPAGARLQASRAPDRAHHAAQNARDQHPRPGAAPSPPAGCRLSWPGQPMLMSMISAPASTLRRAASAIICGIEAGDLHDARAGLAAYDPCAGATSAYPTGARRRVSISEAASPAPKLAAQHAKRSVGHSRHRREHDVGGQTYRVRS